jgi:hypothetical protein
MDARRRLEHCFELQGPANLKDLLPIHKSHPQTTVLEVVERYVDRSPTQPASGCVRLSDRLKLDGVSVSSPTIQSIVIKRVSVVVMVKVHPGLRPQLGAIVTVATMNSRHQARERGGDGEGPPWLTTTARRDCNGGDHEFAPVPRNESSRRDR